MFAPHSKCQLIPWNYLNKTNLIKEKNNIFLIVFILIYMNFVILLHS